MATLPPPAETATVAATERGPPASSSSSTGEFKLEEAQHKTLVPLLLFQGLSINPLWSYKLTLEGIQKCTMQEAAINPRFSCSPSSED